MAKKKKAAKPAQTQPATPPPAPPRRAAAQTGPRMLEPGHLGHKVAQLAAQIVRDHQVAELPVQLHADGEGFRATLLIEPAD